MKDKLSSRKLAAGVILLIALISTFAFIYPKFAPKGMTGKKSITIEIITPDNTRELKITTKAEFLRGALDQENLVQGEEGSFGLYVKTVDGVTADQNKQEWWKFTKSGEMLNTSVDQTPIADGDQYEITFTKGW